MDKFEDTALNELTYSYFYSSDIDHEIEIHIERLLIINLAKTAEIEPLDEINVKDDMDFSYFTAQIISSQFNQQVMPIYSSSGRISDSIDDLKEVSSTQYSAVKTKLSKHICQITFLHWLRFPLRYKDLSIDSYLELKLYSVSSVLKGICTVPLFSSVTKSTLCHLLQGVIRVQFVPKHDEDKDPSLISFNLSNEPSFDYSTGCKGSHSGNVAIVIDEFDFDTTENDWVKLKRQSNDTNLNFRRLENSLAIRNKSGMLFEVCLRTKTFEHPVFFKEKVFQPLYKTSISDTGLSLVAQPTLSNSKEAFNDPELCLKSLTKLSEVTNPIEDLTRKLNAFVSREKVEDHIKPDFTELQIIEIILSKEVTELSVVDKNLLWKYQVYLSSSKEAYLHFIFSVSWRDDNERIKALTLLNSWTQINIFSIIQLLSLLQLLQVDARLPVMKHLLEMLDKITTEKMRKFLLQIVQAFRFDIVEEETEGFPEIGLLTAFTVKRSLKSFELASFLMWHIEVEVSREENVSNGVYKHIQQYFYFTLQQAAKSDSKPLLLELDVQRRATKKIMSLFSLLQKFNEKAYQREERLKLIIQTYPEYIELNGYSYPVSLPLYPNVKFKRVKSETAQIIASNSYPIVLDLCLSGKHDQLLKRIMFKTGDDLRQDELVVQFISLFDYLLKKENINLNLTSYRVLATDKEQGLIEFVNKSFPISKVLGKHETIINFFKYHQQTKTLITTEESYVDITTAKIEPDLDPAILERFIKSCAGFCVISYILGFGDRHLDNLMLKPSGEMFHIDFGYIFGRDPKTFATEIRLTKEMIVTMGGRESEGYKKFKFYASLAYRELRKHFRLFTSMLHLMKHSKIPDLTETQTFARAFGNFKRKFHLQMTEEVAVKTFLELVDKNAEALAPVIYDMIHRAAVAIK